MGKYFDKRISQLGGERLLDLGLGDDDANIEEDFNNWKVNFWQSLCEKYSVSRLENQAGFTVFTIASRILRMLMEHIDFKSSLYS